MVNQIPERQDPQAADRVISKSIGESSQAALQEVAKIRDAFCQSSSGPQQYNNLFNQGINETTGYELPQLAIRGTKSGEDQVQSFGANGTLTDSGVNLWDSPNQDKDLVNNEKFEQSGKLGSLPINDGKYTIKSGDNLTKIARQILGKPSDFDSSEVQSVVDDLAKANGIVDRNLINEGSHLSIPKNLLSRMERTDGSDNGGTDVGGGSNGDGSGTSGGDGSNGGTGGGSSSGGGDGGTGGSDAGGGTSAAERVMQGARAELADGNAIHDGNHCLNGVENALENAGYTGLPRINAASDMADVLAGDERFQEVSPTDVQPGDIIVHSSTGPDGAYPWGHIGIVMADGTEVSDVQRDLIPPGGLFPGDQSRVFRPLSGGAGTDSSAVGSGTDTGGNSGTSNDGSNGGNNDGTTGGTNDAPSGGDNPATASDAQGRQKQITDYLTNQGFSPEQIAGIEGNMAVETGGTFDPNSFNPGEGAIGICQWEGGRRTALQEFAASQGKDETDLGVQLDFLMQELHGSEGTANADLQGATTPEAAAQIFQSEYERSSTESLGDRIAQAEQIYQQQFGSST